MAVNINVPSQVKTYANLAAFPATGALKTIYIAEDTNKTYRWTGSVYTEISASAAMTWGAIGGTLSNQTDLQSALDAKVPTSRTLTINGVTQDLSANRTFTISTGITIGSTAITSGSVGRILFEGTGNVVQESSSLFWDATNNRLGIGTETPTTQMQIVGSSNASILTLTSGTRNADIAVYGSGSLFEIGTQASYPLSFKTNSTGRMIIYGGGNIGINTTTDAGFRLDVNGTARVQGLMSVSGTSGISLYGTTNLEIYTESIGATIRTTNPNIRFGTNNATRMMLAGSNVLIGTQTDVASSLLTLESTTKGFLPPRMTTTQKNAIASPATGLIVYDTTLNVISYYNGSMWI